MSGRTISSVSKPGLGIKHYANGAEPEVTTLLISDNALLLLGLQQVLQGTPLVIARAASSPGPDWLQQLASQPTLVLIDANQNAGRALEAIRQAREQSPEARIVVLADHFDLSFVRLGHEAGVDGFCPAASAPEVLIKRLELVMLGESVLPCEVLRSMSDDTPESQAQPLQSNSAEQSLPDLMSHKLSAREAQILSCLREGAPNKVIARNLAITEATIKVHVKAILRKIGVSNRTQAAMWATKYLPRGGAVHHTPLH